MLLVTTCSGTGELGLALECSGELGFALECSGELGELVS